MITANEWHEYTDEEMEHPLETLKRLLRPEPRENDDEKD